MPSPTFIPVVPAPDYQKLEELIHELENVSGYRVHHLISLFAAGYDFVRTERKTLEESQRMSDL